MKIKFCERCGFSFCPDLAGDRLEHMDRCRRVEKLKLKHPGYLATFQQQERVKRQSWNLVYSRATLPVKVHASIWILWAWFCRAKNRKRASGSFERYIINQLQRDPQTFPPEIMDALCEMYDRNRPLNIVAH
ncbi:MAG: hypothetical protein NC238_14025 [Dehalobacter sp.]|nr:hypothetical protein [Dehalobacter sp.]